MQRANRICLDCGARLCICRWRVGSAGPCPRCLPRRRTSAPLRGLSAARDRERLTPSRVCMSAAQQWEPSIPFGPAPHVSHLHLVAARALRGRASTRRLRARPHAPVGRVRRPFAVPHARHARASTQRLPPARSACIDRRPPWHASRACINPLQPRARSACITTLATDGTVFVRATGRPGHLAGTPFTVGPCGPAGRGAGLFSLSPATTKPERRGSSRSPACAPNGVRRPSVL